MPQPALHVLLARQTLEAWRAAPADAPFDPDSPGADIRFLHGSLGPDMGFFPGGDARISLLAHGLRTGALARTLLADARTEQERAFAWGWVAHVLADVCIHPLVNAAGTRLAARRHEPARRLVDHVRVEVGIDAWYFGRDPALQAVRLRHAFDARSIRFLARALRRTYGPALPRTRLLSSHRSVTRAYNAYTRLLTMLVAERRRADAGLRPAATLSMLRAAVARRFAATTPTYGFIHPVAPAESFLAQIESAVAQSARDLQYHVATGLAYLPDYDLETGGLLAAQRRPAWARDGTTRFGRCEPVFST